jgi:hypothetical protein
MDDIHPDEKKRSRFQNIANDACHMWREREHGKRGDPKWMIFIQVNTNVVPQSVVDNAGHW